MYWDTVRRTPGLANVRMSGQTARRSLRESGFRARRPVVWPILKQRHRIARLAWARARRRWRLQTWQHILFSDESRFPLIEILDPWPPLAATTASYLRRIEPINRWIKDCGMLFHWCTGASRSSCSVSGGFWRWRTRLPSSSHKCSNGNTLLNSANLHTSWQFLSVYDLFW
jgi:hypothetical protein